MVKTKQVISLIQDGLNFSQTAKALKCSRNTVKAKFRNYVKNHSLVVPSNLWGISPKSIRAIVQLKEDGQRAEDIATNFDISKSYVYKLVKKWS